MVQPIINDKCSLSPSAATFLWLFAPWGVILWLGIIGFGIFALFRYFRNRGVSLPGPNIFTKLSQAKHAQQQANSREEQEARTRAMRLSGLEVEMNRVGRAHDADSLKDCEAAYLSKAAREC